MALIIKEIKNNIGTINLNNPEKRNALSKELLNGLINALEEFKSNNVRAVVLRAPKGSKVW